MQIEAFARLIQSIQSVHLSSDDSTEVRPKSNASIEKPDFGKMKQEPGNLQRPKKAPQKEEQKPRSRSRTPAMPVKSLDSFVQRYQRARRERSRIKELS